MSDTSRDMDLSMAPKPLAPIKEDNYKRPFLSSFFTALIFFFCFLFLILVQTGNTATAKHVGSVYFFKLDLSKVIPDSAPDAKRIMDIAHRLGVHDFYQVGLWNYCEGDVGPGLTFCGKPKSLYWFNPIDIFESELLNGAFNDGTITLPPVVLKYLKIVHIASNVVFVLFFISTLSSFISILLSPLVLVFSSTQQAKIIRLPLNLLTSLTAFCLFLASTIATAMFTIFAHEVNINKYTSKLRIKGEVGTKMVVFMWIATTFALIGALMGCCTGGRKKSEKNMGYEERVVPGNRWWRRAD